MNDIIKGTKEQNLISLSHQQTLLSEQNKKLREMIDNIQTQVFGRQQGIENEINDHRAKLQEIETVVVKNVTQANRTVETELARFEKIISAFEKYIDNQISDIKEQNKAYFDQVQDLNGNSGGDGAQLDDLKTTINLINNNISKISDDSRDKIKLLKEEFVTSQTVLQQQLHDLANKVSMEDSTLQARVQLAFDKTNGKFKDYFETMMLDHQKQMASIGQETNARFLQNNKDIEKYIDGQLLVLRDNLLNERLKGDTIMEGKAQQYTIEIESRVMQKVSQMLDDSTKMREEILSKL